MQQSPFANQVTTTPYSSTGQLQAPATPPGPGPAPGLLGDVEKLAPTAGSVLGGIAGTALGPLGMVGGSALGSAAGQGLEDMFTGQGAGNTIPAAVEGGVGGALGLGLGGVLGKVGAMAGSKLAGDAASQEAAEKVAQTAADATTKFHEFSQAMPSADEQTRAGLGSAIDLAENLGVNTHVPGFAQNMSDLSGAVTRTNGGLNVLKKNILDQVGPIDMDKAGQVVRNTIESNLGSIVDKDPTKPATQLYKQLQPGLAAPLSPQSSSQDALDWLSQIGKRVGAADKAVAKDPTNVDAQGKANALHQIYDQTHSMIYARPGVQEALSDVQAKGPVTPEMFLDNEEYNKGLENLPDMTKKLAAQHMANVVNNAGSMRDITKAESQFVKMGQLADDAVKTNKEAVATSAVKSKAEAAAKEASQPVDTNGMSLADHVKTAGAAAAGPHVLIPHLVQMGAKYGGSPGLNVLSKLGEASGSKMGKIAAQSAAQLLLHAPNFQSQPVTGAIGGAGMQQNNPGSELSNGAATSPADLLAQLDAMMAADPNLAGAIAPQMTALMQKSQAINAAQSALTQYQGTLGAAGGGQGLIGGLLARLGGVMGGPAAQVGPQAQSAEQALAAAGVPGVQLPGLTSTGAGVQAGIAQPQGVLSALGASQ